MSKINRQNLTEKYSVTSDWIMDFRNNLAKNADTIDYLKEYLDSVYNKPSFNSVEEKIADIKNRIGFDLSNRVID